MPAPTASQGKSVRNLAVFIDADNLHDCTALDHVLTELRQRADRMLYRRAYGRPESLRTIESVLMRHAVRPVANMVVGNKITTDSSLIIDAVEAVCTNDIDAVAICSGDADFAPLATWLREKGCLVWCFGLATIVFANAQSFYDEVVLIELVEPQAELSVPAQPPAPLPASSPAQLMKESAKLPEKSVVAPVKALAQPEQAAVPGMPPELARVLKLLPDLRHKPQLLSVIVPKLKQEKLIGQTAGAGAKLFRQWPEWVELRPAHQPNQVALRSKVLGCAIVFE